MTLIKSQATHSSEETENVGYEFAKLLSAGDFVAMRGDLGAGKTAFVRGMAKYLSPGARVSSPTYTIVNIYGGKIPLCHFDMYRIDGEESLYSTGFFDYQDGRSVCVVEWSEKIAGFIPVGSYEVSISKAGENDRTIEIKR